MGVVCGEGDAFQRFNKTDLVATTVFTQTPCIFFKKRGSLSRYFQLTTNETAIKKIPRIEKDKRVGIIVMPTVKR